MDHSEIINIKRSVLISDRSDMISEVYLYETKRSNIKLESSKLAMLDVRYQYGPL